MYENERNNLQMLSGFIFILFKKKQQSKTYSSDILYLYFLSRFGNYIYFFVNIIN